MWLVDRLIKRVLSHWETPQAVFPASHSGGVWPEDPYGVRIHDFSDYDLRDHDAQERFLEEMKTLTADEEIEISIEWGLELPNGDVQWGSWSNIDFSTQLDRLRMIAALQKTALDIGLNENGQSDEFLNKYKWQTREKKSKISYRNTGATFSLTDPAVSAAPVENSTYDEPKNDPDSSTVDSHRDLHPGSVGGDA